MGMIEDRVVVMGPRPCPRCGERMDGRRPAYSRVDDVAICGPCGSHEAWQQTTHGGVSARTAWPLPAVRQELEELLQAGRWA
jgi:ribosomal protein S27AE